MAQHRSKSVFARSRVAQQRPGADRDTEPPVIQPTPIVQQSTPSEGSEGDSWRARMSEENERRVAAMTEQERDEERREIEERFGKNIREVLERARMAREANKSETTPGASLEKDIARGVPDDSGITRPGPPSAYTVNMR